MKLQPRVLLGLVVISMLAVGCIDASCGTVVVSDTVSPDRKRHVVVFVRDCGATTGISTHVALLPRNQSARDAGTLLVIDSDHGKAPVGPGGGPPVGIRWIDAQTVEVRYPPSARAFTRVSRYEDAEIRYVADNDPAWRP